MIRIISSALRKTPLRPLYRAVKRRLFPGTSQPGTSQSNESVILEALLKSEKPPLTFVEFGFHPTEFNCINLLNRARGLLVDGDEASIIEARKLFPKSIDVVHALLTLDNLEFIRERFSQIGVLSVD